MEEPLLNTWSLDLKEVRTVRISMHLKYAERLAKLMVIVHNKIDTATKNELGSV